MYELMVEDTFDSAHALRGYKGPCENMHGHTFRVQVFLSGEKLNKLGLLMDFREIRNELKKILDKFDHQNLNEVSEFKNQNPSSENIAKIVFEELKKTFPHVAKVTVWESASTCATYWESEK